VLLVLLGAISLFVFPADVPKQRPVASYWYRGLGGVIWLSLLLMPILNKYAGSFYDRDHVFFILESVCVIAFSLAFIIKGNARLVDHEYNNVAEHPDPALQIGVPNLQTALTSSQVMAVTATSNAPAELVRPPGPPTGSRHPSKTEPELPRRISDQL
jgi:hypothetical protein